MIVNRAMGWSPVVRVVGMRRMHFATDDRGGRVAGLMRHRGAGRGALRDKREQNEEGGEEPHPLSNL